VYFAEQGIDINITDNRGSTPLHWACYSRAEIALNYLLAMNPELEIKD
jgi:ankyrin repeat protein